MEVTVFSSMPDKIITMDAKPPGGHAWSRGFWNANSGVVVTADVPAWNRRGKGARGSRPVHHEQKPWRISVLDAGYGRRGMPILGGRARCGISPMRDFMIGWTPRANGWRASRHLDAVVRDLSAYEKTLGRTPAGMGLDPILFGGGRNASAGKHLDQSTSDRPPVAESCSRNFT